MTKREFEDAVEEHLQRFRKPDGYCLHCQRPANRYHLVGPITVTLSAPDDGGRTNFAIGGAPPLGSLSRPVAISWRYGNDQPSRMVG